MRSVISVLAVLALSLVAVAGDDQKPEDGEETRLAALKNENLLLKRRIAELEQEIDQLWAKLRDKKYTATISIPFDGRERPSHLEGIELPESPSKNQVRRYVVSVLRAADQHRGGYSAEDPEIALLVKVGPSNVDVLVEPLLYGCAGNNDTYLLEALKSLAREENRKYILWQLPMVRELAEVVLAKGWTAEAGPILIEALADRDAWTGRNYLPPKWIEAVAQLELPKSYDDLKTYLYYGLNRYHTWEAIHELPGIELGDTVESLWEWAKDLDDRSIRREIAGMAAHYGRRDALAVLFEDPKAWPAWNAIGRLTDLRTGDWGWAEKAKRWYSEHKDRLVFDPAQCVWRVSDAGEQQKR